MVVLAALAPCVHLPTALSKDELDDLIGMLKNIVKMSTIYNFVPVELRGKLVDEVESLRYQTWTLDGPLNMKAFVEFLTSETVREKIPALAELALALATLQPTEASVERMFSLLKRLFGDRRFHLDPANVVASVQLREVLKASAIEVPTSDGATPISMS